ncbi:MAG: Maf family protein, partial [Gemmobacter sp.]
CSTSTARPSRNPATSPRPTSGCAACAAAPTAALVMRDFSHALLAEQLARAGAAATETPGAYRVEDFGIRLFSRIEGDHFAILGLPLVPLLAYLALRGVIAP